MSLVSIMRVNYNYDDHVQILSAANTKEGPFHAWFRDMPYSSFGFVGRFSQMKILLLLRGHSTSHINHVPYGSFMSFDLLQVLDLSRLRVSKVLSSIGVSSRAMRK